MSTLTIDRALALLRERGGYDWLIDGPQAWGARDVADRLTAMGLSVTRETVAIWFRQLPHTQDFGRLGLSASRGDLLVFFASRMQAAADDRAM